MGSINWDDMLSGDFIKLEEGVVKTLTFQNWKPQETFKDDKTQAIRPGITMEVISEDGKIHEKPKAWTVTAKGALEQLKPLIETAEAEGKTTVKCTVIKVGQNKDTKYSIKKVV